MSSAGGGETSDPGDALRELDFLQRLALEAAATQHPDELVALIIRETTSALDTDVCSFYLVDESGERLVLEATNGLNPRMVGRASLAVGEGITGWVAASRQPFLVADVNTEARFKWVAGVDQKRFHSMLSVPIEAGPRLVGVLNVQSAEERRWRTEDVQFLRAIAGQVAGILERMELQRRLEDQLQEIRLSHEIHTRFTQLSLAGAGVVAILDAVGSLAGGGAALYTVEGFHVESSTAGAGWPRHLDIGQRRLVPGSVARVSAARGGGAYDVVAVQAGDDVLGVLAVTAASGAPSTRPPLDDAAPGRLRALEHGATVLALELAKDRSAAEVERRLRGDLVEELLAGGLEPAEAERLARQAAALGSRLAPRSWVLVLEADDPDSEVQMNARGREDRVHAALSDMARRRLGGALTLTRAASAVVVVPDHVAPDLETAEKLAALVSSTVAPLIRPATASVGIGNLAHSVADLARSHQEARQALRLLRRAGGRGRVTSYRALGAFRLLLEVQSPEALGRFVEEVLGPLLRYAESRDTPLLATLEALAAARWVRSAAARALGIHINSMSYRVARIEALAGVDLDDPETRVAIAIALRARSMASPEHDRR